jgi:hypothetical protein
MLPQRASHRGVHRIRSSMGLRYLVNMYFAIGSTLLMVMAAPLLASAQTGPLSGLPVPGNGATQTAATTQVDPGGAPASPGAQEAVSAKLTPVLDLRSVLQIQKARMLDLPKAERHLTAQELAELRKLLRQQREGTREGTTASSGVH